MNSIQTINKIIVSTMAGWLFPFWMMASDVKIDTGYPGGNIIVEKRDGDTFFIKPELRDTRGWWFYWNFRVTGAAGRTLTFCFTNQNPIGVRGPAMSTDCGIKWRWMGAGAVRQVSGQKAWEFSHKFTDDQEVRFSYEIPYLEADFNRFLERYRGNNAVMIEELCKTDKGRKVEYLRLGKLTGDPKYRVLLTARHHACESVPSYTLEGVMEEILADSADGKVWREQVEVMIIPFVDKDGVEEGDQGKNRQPHDHNRDYNEKSIHAEVTAIMEKVPVWGKGKLMFAMDMHCPYIRGDYNEHIYFVGGSDSVIWERVMNFSRMLESGITGPLPYRASGNLPFGKGWNTGGNYKQGKNCASWMREIPGIMFASGIEIPYANTQGAEVNAATARAFGHDLGRTILKYLVQEKR